jgi:hypothetical protein
MAFSYVVAQSFAREMTEGIITLPQSLPSREGSLKEELDLP